MQPSSPWWSDAKSVTVCPVRHTKIGLVDTAVLEVHFGRSRHTIKLCGQAGTSLMPHFRNVHRAQGHMGARPQVTEEAASSSATPRAVLSRATARPRTSGTAIDHTLSNSDNKLSCHSPSRCRRTLKKPLLETHVHVPHHKGQSQDALFQMKHLSDLFDKELEPPEVLSQEPLKISSPFSHGVELGHRSAPTTDQRCGKPQHWQGLVRQILPELCMCPDYTGAPDRQRNKKDITASSCVAHPRFHRGSKVRTRMLLWSTNLLRSCTHGTRVTQLVFNASKVTEIPQKVG